MSFDERALLVEQELWITSSPRRPRWLDGPVWWIGPILILAAVGALLPRSPAPAWQKTTAETSEPAPCEGEAIVSASTSLSRN
jgi:hypothetical protein